MCVMLVGLWVWWAACGTAQTLWPVPAEMASRRFQVSINGVTTPVMLAAMNDYFLNVEAGPRMEVVVTAATDDYWSRGVEIQPWRLGIRPVRQGRTLRFTLNGPAKIVISRPNEPEATAERLFLFANAKETYAPTQAAEGLQYFGPGVYHQNIDAVAGQSIYLAPGAVVFGGLNIWRADHVHVFGRGVMVYDGPQNPHDDDGWKHQKNWHCIVMDEATDVSIEGITCVVRSRTWQIQMKDSRRIAFDNVKVIGANPGNANADGMDWLGGGDTTVNDSFVMAADDVFAMQGSWDGYDAAALADPGSPVTNVTVTKSVLAQSISNVVRAGWPGKNFEGGNFLMKDTDVIHSGVGGCGVPFALMEVWADPLGRGKSAGFGFDDVRLEEWYSLTQLMEPVDGVSNVWFQDVMGLESPARVGSVLKGQVSGVRLDNVVLGDVLATKDADVPMTVEDHAQEPQFASGGPVVRIGVHDGLIRRGDRVALQAVVTGSTQGLQYAWSFGDGTMATGARVWHTFADADGTLLDGSGRFRVLLHVTDAKGRSTWSYAPVVVAKALLPAVTDAAGAQPGIAYRYEEKPMVGVESLRAESTSGVNAQGVSATLDVATLRHRSHDYTASFHGLVEVPEDGGYTFTLLSNESATLTIDGAPLLELPTPFANLCGLAGDAVQQRTSSVALAKGRHRIAVAETHDEGADGFRVLWQRAGGVASEIPATALFHAAQTPAATTPPTAGVSAVK